VNEDSGSKAPVRLIVGGVIALVALIFVFQNRGTGRVEFLFWTIEAAAWLWLLATFAVGVIVGWLLARSRLKRRT
jgi:uncharacterized integral membrane protein